MALNSYITAFEGSSRPKNLSNYACAECDRFLTPSPFSPGSLIILVASRAVSINHQSGLCLSVCLSFNVNVARIGRMLSYKRLAQGLSVTSRCFLKRLININKWLNKSTRFSARRFSSLTTYCINSRDRKVYIPLGHGRNQRGDEGTRPTQLLDTWDTSLKFSVCSHYW